MRRRFASGVSQGRSQLVFVRIFEVVDDTEGERAGGLVTEITDESDDAEKAVGVATTGSVAETSEEFAELGEEDEVRFHMVMFGKLPRSLALQKGQ